MSKNIETQQGAINNNPINQSNEKRKTRKGKVPPVYQIVRSAMAQFKRQITQDTECKKKCLVAAVTRMSHLYPDALRFWADFRVERDKLLDSHRFCKECKSRSLKPENVADHVVCEGKAIVNKVLLNGILPLGERVQMYKDPLWEDTFSLYATPNFANETKEDSDE